MNTDDIRLLKEHRKNFIGERVEFQFYGTVHERKHFTGGLWFDSFDKTISNPGWIENVKYTLQIDYDCLKIHCYNGQKYKELILPYKVIMEVYVNDKVLEMGAGDSNIIIRLNDWDKERIKNLAWFLTWANRAAIEGIIFNDEKEIQARNDIIKKKRQKQAKKTENKDIILAILFIGVVIGLIIAVINQFMTM